ncbi:rubredoxin-like [Zingiber officinale]|uniref:Rubredoxin-like domain-containing protein n=1 Tax=Zingiber officinale TaxID=94328 RepID=A0A8J5LMF0_ZINOF|nr:rubredoxin-like [Zingiber officinale]KAG6518524.1 hypothetical protein ZIOFF_022000 [Zingiber officinale]
MMASSIAKLPFPFHHCRSCFSSKAPRSVPNFHHCPSSFSSIRRSPLLLQTVASSVDVSKEDKPVLSTEPGPEGEADGGGGPKLDPRRLEEKFAVLNTGIYECRSCGYRYNEAAGDPAYPIPPGFQFEKLPDDWRCPTCGAARSFFESKSVEIAGFAQNQQFGFGGNSLTSGQKTLLIYGGLLLGFVFFISGYFLQ